MCMALPVIDVTAMLQSKYPRTIQMMKALLAICMLVSASFVLAGETPITSTVKGQVLETMDVESYTYLRLKTKDGETWAAVGKTPVKKGAEVTIENTVVMKNFESKSLKKTFDSIVFGTIASTDSSAHADMASPHGATAKAVDLKDVKVSK